MFIFDTAEDIVLGYIAKERYIKSTENDYVDIEEVLRNLGTKY